MNLTFVGFLAGFESIACCADSNYTDPKTNLNYTTDYRWYSDKSNCRQIPEILLSHRSNITFRLFDIDEGKRCYNLPTIKDQVYLIRGTFPFDSVNTSFYVSIGATELGEVTSSRLEYLEIEGVFRAPKDNIDFCLLKEDVNPFISQLELRPLPEEYLHDFSTNVLKLISRNNFGGIEDDIRYVNPFISQSIIFAPHKNHDIRFGLDTLSSQGVNCKQGNLNLV